MSRINEFYGHHYSFVDCQKVWRKPAHGTYLKMGSPPLECCWNNIAKLHRKDVKNAKKKMEKLEACAPWR
jgi:hypothetical protein